MTDLAKLASRVAKLAERDRAKSTAARAAWPEFAAFVDDFRRVFGHETKARQLRQAKP